MNEICNMFLEESVEVVNKSRELYDRGERTNTMQESLSEIWSISDKYFDRSYFLYEDLKEERASIFQRVYFKAIELVSNCTLNKVKFRAEKFIRSGQ